MKVLRPDPAEYIEDVGCGPIRPIDVLCGALGYADAYGVELNEIYHLALEAESVRDFDRLVAARVEEVAQWIADQYAAKTARENTGGAA